MNFNVHTPNNSFPGTHGLMRIYDISILIHIHPAIVVTQPRYRYLISELVVHAIVEAIAPVPVPNEAGAMDILELDQIHNARVDAVHRRTIVLDPLGHPPHAIADALPPA